MGKIAMIPTHTELIFDSDKIQLVVRSSLGLQIFLVGLFFPHHFFRRNNMPNSHWSKKTSRSFFQLFQKLKNPSQQIPALGNYWV
jgi:hypothetical protein